jgi:hypothetical protein
VAAVGISSSVAGGVAVFVTENGTGSAALTTTGALCVVVAALWDRMKTLKGGGLEVELLQVAQQKLIAADAADSRGDDAAAATLRAEAEGLLSLARPWAADYERWRRHLPSGPDRTALMGESVAQARESAERSSSAGEGIDPRAVAALFNLGTEGARITALGFMQGDPHAVDLDIVLGAIADSRSAFEQAVALSIADELSRQPSLDDETAQRLLNAARAALATGRVQRSRSRRASAEAIIRRLADRSSPT